ncbi:MAG: glycosyltransferase [Bacillota bacterium]
MKILNVINSFNYGGAENLLLNSLSFFKEYNHEIKVLSLSNKLKLNVREHENIIDYVDSKSPKSLISFFALFNHLKENKYDIIHAHLFPTIYYCSIIKKLGIYNAPLVITEHSTHNKRRDINLLKPIEKFVYKSFDDVICISKGTKDNLNDWIVRDKSMKTVYNGIDLKKFSYDRPKYNYEDKSEIKLIMVASFSKQKDQLTVIKSLQKLPKEFKLYFAGEGPKLGQAKKLVDNLGLSDRVIFLGNRNDIPDLLKTMDIFILSSNWEGFGLVVVEAMASGLPVIVSNIPGLSEVVNGYGKVFEQGNKKELSEIILEISTNNELYKKLAEKSVERAQDFSMRKMVEEYINIYENLVDDFNE